MIEAGLTLPDEILEAADKNKRIFLSVMDKKQLPAIIACVEKWELENLQP